jgi:hypothetical protein
LVKEAPIAAPETIYTLDGKQQPRLQKGLNILRSRTERSGKS